MVIAIVDVVLLATYAGAFRVREAGHLAGQVLFLIVALVILLLLFMIVICISSKIPTK